VTPRSTAATSGAAGLLRLAAAPTFAAMALWNSLSAGQSDMLCLGMQDASSLNGMALMYALMSAFHAAPWVKLVSGRRGDANRADLTSAKTMRSRCAIALAGSAVLIWLPIFGH
jgi:hypothetical protein